MIIAHNCHFCNSHFAQNIHIYIINAQFLHKKSTKTAVAHFSLTQTRKSARGYASTAAFFAVPQKGSPRALGARLPKKGAPAWGAPFLEQATGIEPAASAWEAEVLPLDYACEHTILYTMRGILSMPPHAKGEFFHRKSRQDPLTPTHRTAAAHKAATPPHARKSDAPRHARA